MLCTTLDLSGQWQFREYPACARRMRDVDDNNWFAAEAPCSIFDCLAGAGMIDREQLFENPEDFEWVSSKAWLFRKTFDMPGDFSNADRIDLVMEGLDTIGSIWLNEKLIAKTNNMFIPWRFDVTSAVKKKSNCLMVKFDPSLPVAWKLAERYGQINLPQYEFPERVYVRKAQYQFGWDFCPSLPGCGIFRPVRLEAIKKGRIANVHIRTLRCSSEAADVKIDLTLDPVCSGKYSCTLKISGPDNNTQQVLTCEPDKNNGSAVFHIKNPLLWWPRTHGRPDLYSLEAELLCEGDPIDMCTQQFGIRTIRVDQSEDKFGRAFRFEINGMPIFIKGANWVPSTIFADSNNTDCEKLIKLAADANMNMLRVWGGGSYEDQKFYESCDRLGILVWQDFPFACRLYPDRQWFLTQVRHEVELAVKQLRNHPSVALWCGNNEIQWLFYQVRGRKFYSRKIFHDLLPKMLAELDPDRPYICSTPFSHSCDPNEPQSGTKHEWQIWAGYAPVSEYVKAESRIPRFLTEFGMQSLPNEQTLSMFGPAKKLTAGSRSLEKHNYQIDGSARLARYTSDLFAPPRNLEELVYFSQLTQARGIKICVEHLRANPGINSGMLFWQLNDCFPAISWAAIDYQRTPKALYYYARRFYSPIIVVITPGKNPVIQAAPALASLIHSIVINDSPRPLTGILDCRVMDFYGNATDQVSFPLSIAPFTCSTQIKLPQVMAQPKNPDSCFLLAELRNDQTLISQNSFFYLPDKYINLPDAEIETQLEKAGDNQYMLSLVSNVFAKDVRIKVPIQASVEDNFIDLMPGKKIHVTIRPQGTHDLNSSMIKLDRVRQAD
ncbi:MAG: glycoside hydrolase family 2 protein [Planctomycetota bacterium]